MTTSSVEAVGAPGRLRADRRIEAAAFVLAGLVLAVVSLKGESLMGGAGSVGDEQAYLRYAHNLTHGSYAIASQASHGLYLWHGPGLPLVLAPFVALGIGVRALRMLGPVSLVLAGWFCWLLLRRRTNRWIALAAGLVLALFPPYLRLVPHLFSEPFALMLLMAGAWALDRAHGTGQVRWSILAGAAWGWMVLTRVEEGWLLLIALVVTAILAAFRRNPRHLLNFAAVAAAFVVCLPWLGYTASLTGKFPYWAASGGLSLYWMASTTPGNTGSWISDYQVAHDPRLRADDLIFRRIEHLSQVQQDARLQHIALSLIRHHPGVYAEHVGQNLSRMIIGTPYTFQSAGRGVYLYGVPDVLLLLALAAAIWILRRSRDLRLGEAIRLLGIFAVLNLLIHLVVAAYTRMNTLSIPGAILVVALGAEAYARSRRSRAAMMPRAAGTNPSAPPARL